MPATYLDNRKIKKWLLDTRALKRVRCDGSVVFESSPSYGPYLIKPYLVPANWVTGGQQAYYVLGNSLSSSNPSPLEIPGGKVIQMFSTWPTDPGSYIRPQNLIYFDKPNIGRGLKSITINGVVFNMVDYTYREITQTEGSVTSYWINTFSVTSFFFKDDSTYNVAFNF